MQSAAAAKQVTAASYMIDARKFRLSDLQKMYEIIRINL
jgi:hypothetical protein